MIAVKKPNVYFYNDRFKLFYPNYYKNLLIFYCFFLYAQVNSQLGNLFFNIDWSLLKNSMFQYKFLFCLFVLKKYILLLSLIHI